MPQSYIKRILNARVYDVARETPIDEARLLSQRLGNRILLKREDMQPVFSFKCRGAFNKLAQLSREQLDRGVIAASAGNHAQGLALAAATLKVKAIIVMPKTTPSIKVEAVKSRGAKAILFGDTFEEAVTHARELVETRGYIYIPPYDDPDIIAGQGTIGVEIVRQLSHPPDAIFIPVGGGGLLAGVAAFVRYMWPEIKIYGVEPADAACLELAMRTGRRGTLKEVGLFAEGCAVAQIGKETFRVIKDLIDGVITVSSDEMCAAIKDIFEDTRCIAEPAGALALAGLKKFIEAEKLEGKTLLTIVSGANTNFDRLRYISERTEVGEKREAVLSAVIPERPGAFKTFCQAVGKRNITEFNYRYSDANQARVFVGLTVNPTTTDRIDLLDALRAQGYSVDDLTDNEMAKLHVRFMVGGHVPGQVGQECVYRFEFPERPGALGKFLSVLGNRWNISLFHYRNHGAAYGRVLVGFQVGESDRPSLEEAFKTLGYRYWNETDNTAYQQFLAATQ